MRHKLFSTVFTLAAFVKALHYGKQIKKSTHLWLSRIGKTTMAKCGLAMIGALSQQFWSQASKEVYMNLCCNGNLPLLIDDAASKPTISDLAVALYDGAFEGTTFRGSAKTSCMAVVTAFL